LVLGSRITGMWIEGGKKVILKNISTYKRRTKKSQMALGKQNTRKFLLLY
jgi:hypothetical protein